MTRALEALEELKPCPFCGSPGEYDSRHWNGCGSVTAKENNGHAVYCSKAGCMTQFSVVHETKEEAYSAWNTRPSLQPPDVDMEEILNSFQQLINVTELHPEWGDSCHGIIKGVRDRAMNAKAKLEALTRSAVDVEALKLKRPTGNELELGLGPEPEYRAGYNQAIDDMRQRGLLGQGREEYNPDLSKCPNCGGEADNGHDRCDPPNPYYCTKCEAAQPQGDSLAQIEKIRGR